MALISATHWARDPYEPGLFARETRTFGTLTAARAWATTVVAPIVTTNDIYWRDVARGDHVEFTRTRRSRLSYGFTRGRMLRHTHAPAGRYDSPVHLVPSVGELGWTP
jgi:hypothetical protein